MSTEKPMTLSVQELRPEVLSFALLMEARLREKDADKGQSWKNMSRNDLEVHARSKMLEIEHSNTDERAVFHAVDLANYCMMIADVSGALQDSDDNGGSGWAGLDGEQPSPVYDDFMKKSHG